MMSVLFLNLCDDLWVDIGQDGSYGSVSKVRQECVRLLDSTHLVKGIVSAISRDPDQTTLTAVCTVCHTLMTQKKLIIPRTR